MIYASTTPNENLSGVCEHIGMLAVIVIKPDLKFGGYSTCIGLLPTTAKMRKIDENDQYLL